MWAVPTNWLLRPSWVKWLDPIQAFHAMEQGPHVLSALSSPPAASPADGLLSICKTVRQDTDTAAPG